MTVLARLAPPPGPVAPPAAELATVAETEPVGRRERRRRDRRNSWWARTRRVGGIVLTLAVLGAAALLWPASLGGPVSYVKVSGSSMEPRFHTGDLVVVRTSDNYAKGDVISYRVPRGEVGAGAVVIHRITGGSQTNGFVTQGDNRSTPDRWRPRPTDIIGREWFAVSGAGSVMGRLREPAFLALFGGIIVMVGTYSALAPTTKRRVRRASNRNATT